MPPERLNQRDRQTSRHLHGAVVLLLGVAACQSTTISSTSEPTASGAASASAPAECLELDLRTPAGTRVDLTGTWTTGSVDAGSQVMYELHQQGECLWGRAFSAFGDQEPAESFDIILVGTIQSDFTVDLDLLELRLGNPFGYPAFGRASATLGIEFEAADDEPTLPITAIRARLPTAGAPGGMLFVGTGPQVGQVLTRSP